MDLRQLRYFVGVVEAGSFTAAAARMNVAQSALSLHIRQMEERFGTQLLRRLRKGVELTAAGERLLDHARVILRKVAEAEEDLTSKPRSPAGDVTIGIPSGTTRVLVGELLATAQKHYPKIALKIVEGMSGAIEEWLRAGRLNLAILYGGTDMPARGTVLAHEAFYLVTAAGVALPETIPLTALGEYPLVLPMRGNTGHRSLSDVVARQGGALDVRFEVDSLASIITMVVEGKACSILTLSAIRREVEQGSVQAVKIVDPAIARVISLAVNPHDERRPEVAAIQALVPRLASQLMRDGLWAGTIPHDC